MCMRLEFNNQNILCEGEKVVLSKLQPSDYAFCTEARNHAKDHFMDNRIISLEDSSLWLEKRSCDHSNAVLAIRHKETGQFIGMIGYQVDEEDSSRVELGRIAVHIGSLRSLPKRKDRSYKGYAIDASHALIHYCFRNPQVHEVYSFYMQENQLAKRLNEKCWGEVYCTTSGKKEDGSTVKLVEIRLNRDKYQELMEERNTTDENRPVYREFS